MSGPIQELVAGFGRLGRPIATRMPDDLAGPAAEAVFGIVREALTNALRYAPGAAVRIDVRRDEGALDLTVDNDPPRASAQPAGAGLGSGRGVAGMRERAAAVGGQLTAGPGPGGGWRVRATLPDTTGPRTPVVRSRRRDFLREQRLTDGALAFTATVTPLFVALVAAEEWTDGGGWALSSIGVLSVLLALHALPLLWRRRAPWAALAGVMATAWLWPVVRVFTDLPSRFAQFLVGGGCTELLVVYAVAAYGRGAGRTWPAAVAPAFGLAGAVTATAAVDGSIGGGSSLDGIWVWALAVLVALAMGPVICLFLAPVWGAGVAVRARRLRVLAREDSNSPTPYGRRRPPPTTSGAGWPSASRTRFYGGRRAWWNWPARDAWTRWPRRPARRWPRCVSCCTASATPRRRGSASLLSRPPPNSTPCAANCVRQDGR